MFEIHATDHRARAGVLHTAHGKVQTPFFMPVASKGSVKAMEGRDLTQLGYQALISNSFLLSLSAGVDTIQEAGGIHSFMQFPHTVFTDSGGFQVLSKDFLVKKNNQGAVFRNKQGTKILFTPEYSVQQQHLIGSDVAMALDDVAHYGMDGKSYVQAIQRTHAWARRSLLEHKKIKEETDSRQLLFGIAQGGTREEYRRFSTNKISQMDFDGFALGGLVVGESRKELMRSVHISVSQFPSEKIRYLMGLGSPPDIVTAIGQGVDCFDSIYPTSNARHGSLLTKHGRIAIKKKRYKRDFRPIEEGCTCSTCKRYSRAYVHHLLRVHELSGYTLATVHNLHFMKKLLEDARQAILEQRYQEFSQDFLEQYFSGSESKEFGNNIAQRYKEQEAKKKATLYLPYRRL